MTKSSRRITSSREAFTLVELLVVITIIGMLMAMILPAVAAVKEHARQATCISNQSEIVKAIISFEGRKGRFPGYNEKYKPAGGNSGSPLRYAWSVALLPDLSRADLHRKLLANDRDVETAKRIYLKFLVCPSAQMDRDHDAIAYVVNVGRTDEDGDRGKELDTAANAVFHDRLIIEPVNMTSSWIAGRDGVANTLVLSENIQVDKWSNDGSDEKIVGFKWFSQPAEESYINIKKEENITDPMARPSSNHPGGVVVAFCGGKTQFLREDIDYKVYWQLMTPDGFHAEDGQSGPPDEWLRYTLNEEDY